jgi:hypothetical protein
MPIACCLARSAIRQISSSIDTLSDQCLIWFSGINQNTRIITIQLFAKVDNLPDYFQT